MHCIGRGICTQTNDLCLEAITANNERDDALYLSLATVPMYRVQHVARGTY